MLLQLQMSLDGFNASQLQAIGGTLSADPNSFGNKVGFDRVDFGNKHLFYYNKCLNINL